MRGKLVLYSEQEESDTAAIDRLLLRLIGKRRPRLGYIHPVRKFSERTQSAPTKSVVVLCKKF
jgi:hypothetical protein